MLSIGYVLLFRLALAHLKTYNDVKIMQNDIIPHKMSQKYKTKSTLMDTCFLQWNKNENACDLATLKNFLGRDKTVNR